MYFAEASAGSGSVQLPLFISDLYIAEAAEGLGSVQLHLFVYDLYVAESAEAAERATSIYL
jgi:hypothetical protein